METKGHGASRGGGDGIHNEDAFLVDEGTGLYVVCDGASESAAGEVAARIASEAVAASIHESERELNLKNGRIARFAVERAMRRALRAISSAERVDPDVQGLRTTVTLLLVHRHLGIVGHRGDSRAYLVRKARLHRLTVDHELTEAVDSTEGRAEAFDTFGVELCPGDTIILCTDGAEEVVDDPGMTRVAASLSPRLLASRIVSAAARRDPSLDATAVVVQVKGERDKGWLELSEPPRGTAFGHVLGHTDAASGRSPETVSRGERTTR